MKKLLFVLLFFSFFVKAQERCGTNFLPANQAHLKNKVQFEAWMSDRIRQSRISRATATAKTQEILVIPAVFHVIHDGSIIGKGSNISDAKILEQIDILNEDFRRMNDDAGATHSDFDSVAADTEIEFVLAKRDPEGLPTSGIIRIIGKNEYTLSEDEELKSMSFWPPEDYLNIYITNISQGNLGYAQFPFTNLEGIASELKNYRHTDGVVIDYEWVGTNTETGGFDSYGRTATHEIGHYLGLRHIWGDAPTSCSTDDYCDDTPFQLNSSSGCNLDQTTCGSRDMVQNYMDYSDDVCMNLFTMDQKDRMRAVLLNSPRRSTLLTSPALQNPVYVANDLGIRSIISPAISDCSDTSIPRILVRNYGSNDVDSFKISLSINDVVVETVTADSSLGSLATMEVSFNSVLFSSELTNIVTFQVTEVNGTSDQNPENNIKTVSLLPMASVLVPFQEDFESPPPSVFKTTENGDTTQWATVTAPDSSSTNQAAFLPFYDESKNFGIQDRLVTKILDVSSINSATISFKYAYAARRVANTDNTYHLDGLIVAVSTNCGKDFMPENYLFERYGLGLAKFGATLNTPFTPTADSVWQEVTLNLTNHTGYEHLQVAFIGINGGGNNLYLDDIHITSDSLPAYDIGLKKVESLPYVTCTPSLNGQLEIKNFGYEVIDELDLNISINGTSKTVTFTDLDLLSGFSKKLSLPSLELISGINDLSFSIVQINSRTDENIANNTINHQVFINQEKELIPVKEDFEDEPSWSFSTSGNEHITKLVKDSISGNVSLAFNAFNATETGTENHVISKVLQTGSYSEAAIRFKYSYANRTGYNDNLKVTLSSDCGQTYTEEVFNLSSEQLAVANSGTEWIPVGNSPENWKTAFIDISEFLWWNEIRIGLVFTNGNGNNLYLDDLEVVTTNNPDLPSFDDRLVVYPNPTDPQDRDFNVALNLPEKQLVRIRLVDMTGRVLFDQYFPDTINQTYTLKAPSQSGFYLLRVTGKDVLLTKRLYLRRQ